MTTTENSYTASSSMKLITRWDTLVCPDQVRKFVICQESSHCRVAEIEGSVSLCIGKESARHLAVLHLFGHVFESGQQVGVLAISDGVVPEYLVGHGNVVWINERTGKGGDLVHFGYARWDTSVS